MLLVIDAIEGSNGGSLAATLHYLMYHDVPLGLKLEELADPTDWQSWKNPHLNDVLTAIAEDPRIETIFLDPIGLFNAEEAKLIIDTCKKKGIAINFAGKTTEGWTDSGFDFYVDMGPKNP